MSPEKTTWVIGGHAMPVRGLDLSKEFGQEDNDG